MEECNGTPEGFEIFMKCKTNAEINRLKSIIQDQNRKLLCYEKKIERLKFKLKRIRDPEEAGEEGFGILEIIERIERDLGIVKMHL